MNGSDSHSPTSSRLFRQRFLRMTCLFSIVVLAVGTTFTFDRAQSVRSQAATHSVAPTSMQQHRVAHFDLTDLEADRIETAAEMADDAQYASIKSKSKKKKTGGAVGIAALTTIVVTNTSDAAVPPAGSLREAIITANGNGMPDQIVFNIPVSDPG